MNNDAMVSRLKVGFLISSVVGFALIGLGQEAEAKDEQKGPQDVVGSQVDPMEILRVMGEQIGGVSQRDLAYAMVDGVIRKYPDRVQWVGKEDEVFRASGVEGTVMPGGVVYSRLSGMGTGVVEQFVSHWRRIREDGEAGRFGLILDLRQVSGEDLQEVANFASLFLESGIEIFKSGDQVFTTGNTRVSELGEIPLVLLVDGGTSGTGEVLAAVLRHFQGGVIMGEVTAGRGYRFRDVDWSGIGRIRFALNAIVVAEEPGVSKGGVVPDILMNQARRESGLEVPELESDPWVKRALDLLKGVRLLRKSLRN